MTNVISLQDLLLSRVRGSLSSVKQGTWVYPDQPRTDATKPHVSLEVASIPSTPAEIDEGLRRSVANLNVDVYTDSKFIYSAVGRVHSGTLLRDYLWGQIDGDLVSSSRTTLWVSASITDIRPTGGNTFPYDEQNDVYHRQVRYVVEMYG